MTADPIAAVRADMSEFSAVFDSWAQKLTLDMTTQHAAHKQNISDATEEIDALRQQQTALTKAHQALKRECAEEHRAVGKLQELLSSLEKKATDLPQHIDELSKRQAEAAQQAETQHKLLAEVERRCGAELSAMQQRLSPFQRALGLQFIPRQSELQIAFTSIARQQPSRPYLISVYVDGSNEYCVQSCSPAIPQLPELLHELNSKEDGDFGLFLYQVRQAFLSL